MNKPELYSEKNQATYHMEDDKLRLYVGRVPREDYEALRAEGWTSTPKQDCDFVAVWTSAREDTALSYAGEIDDEDQDPADRAADRAERFAGYRDKRTSEAMGHADRYDAGPSAHGYQDKGRATRAADRHDRQAARALTQWDKAEYWTRRTAGVIDNALYKSRPDVRMGRIKKLESDLRKNEKSHTESREAAQAQFDAMLSVLEHAEGKREKVTPTGRQDFLYSLQCIREDEGVPSDQAATPEQIRRAVIRAALAGWRASDQDQAAAKEAQDGTRLAADIARDWLADRTRPQDFDPETGTRYTRHLKHRLAYENQMLEAQGGRAGVLKIEVGGWLRGGRFLGDEERRIVKVNKSPATGRVVSVEVIDNRPSSRNHYGNPYPEGVTKTLIHKVKMERMDPDCYRAPTDEERAAYADEEKARKAEAKKNAPKAPPLVNPTRADAERLQTAFNAQNVARWEKQYGHSVTTAPSYYTRPEPGEVLEMTQAQYSAASKGAYARHETRELCQGGKLASKSWNRKNPAPVVCKVRVTGYEPQIAIHITDKPAKALPAAAWTAYQAPAETPAH